MAREVTAPDGVRWKVGRQWWPWRLRLRRWRPDWQDGIGGDAFGALDDLGAVFVALGVLVALSLLVILALPMFILAIEAVLVVVALVAGLFGRVALRRPWTVRAVAQGHDHERVWHIPGWRASGALADAAADALRDGREPPAGGLRLGPPPQPPPPLPPFPRDTD